MASLFDSINRELCLFVDLLERTFDHDRATLCLAIAYSTGPGSGHFSLLGELVRWI